MQRNVEDTYAIRVIWQNFYKEYFGIEEDFSDVDIPEHREDFDRILIIAKGLSMNQVVEACRKHFKVWLYTKDLDKVVMENDRTSETSHAIRIRDRQEADEENRNKSVDQLKSEGIPGITLLERLVFELFYFIETRGDHLDVENITLCAGSRYSDSLVPYVYWYDGKLRIPWFSPGHAPSTLRSRSVVF